MERLTYKGTPTMTEDGMITPIYCDYSTKEIKSKLADYEDAEEAGLLLRLPCAIGSTVYALAPFCEICEEDLDYGYTCKNCSKGDFVSETKFDYEMIPMFGKVIFLTKEEAKQAFEAMKGGGK